MTNPKPTANVFDKPFSIFEVKDDDVVWHYFSLAKFLDLLKTSSLYFSRTNCFSDDWEGTLPHESARWLDEWFRNAKNTTDESDPQFSILKMFSTYSEYFRKLVVRRTFASCWHRKNGESSLMWAAYGGSADECVAVRTTVGRLRSCIHGLAFVQERPAVSPLVFFANVAYQDPHTTDINAVLDDVEIVPFLVKRPEFCDESEFRMLIDGAELVVPYAAELADANKLNCPKGVHLQVDLLSLIESVVVAPTAGDWFFEVIQKEFELHTQPSSPAGSCPEIPIKKSSLTPAIR